MESLPAGEEHPEADAAVELAAAAGLRLDPWQERVLRASLRRRDGRWAAFEVGCCVARQNGKNALLEARQLAGLFLLNESLQIHSAHLADTAKEAFRRLDELLEANEWLSREVEHVWRTNGHESIELRDGKRIRFRTRTKGGGRGFSGAVVYLDEAMHLPEVAMGSILPVVSAQPDPQIWYTGSAVDQELMDDGVVFSRIRGRGMLGSDPSLAYFEWSAPFEHPSDLEDSMTGDVDLWAAANPALGIRIAESYVEKERRSLALRTFAVERLGVGDWPNPDESATVLPLDAWDALKDVESRIAGDVVFAFDVAPDRSWASVAASGKRSDGLGHVEIAKRDRGTGWVVEWIADRAVRHRAAAVVCDGTGPAGSLIPELEALGVEVTAVTATEHGRACGLLFDAVAQQAFRHLGTPELRAAVRGAAARPLGDAWAWSRKNSQVDISPLVAATLSFWAAETAGKKQMPVVVFA